ncbi:Notch-regulated ankyrin repeat-containing protein B, partial [Caligus rogercresseyi]
QAPSQTQSQFLQLIRENSSSDLNKFLSSNSENVHLNAYNESTGLTPLHSAILDGKTETVRSLLLYGSNPHLLTRDGLSS